MDFSKKNFFIIIFIFLFLDFVFSSIFFKKTAAWNIDLYKGKPWRIASNDYHHGLNPFINEIEQWGESKTRLITNSLGFRDASKKEISKISTKRRILLIGDSFIEGVGFDYSQTLSGLLQKYYNSDYEILNSAVSSYSPSIYYYKTKHFIDNGYKFNMALVFLDVSDVIDEISSDFNIYDSKINTKDKKEENNIKNKIYIFGYFLRDNFITFRFLSIVSDKTEILKNNLKNRYKASKFFKKNFFKIKDKESAIYKMINIDRGNWTRDATSYNNAKFGIEKSEKYLNKLFKLLEENKIKSYLIIYPWPSQIYFGDEFHQNHWKDFSVKQNINFLNLYPYFDGSNKEDTIFKNFILNDVHWNSRGTSIVYEAIKKNEIIK